MILTDYHMHTTYCDGHASAEEMVLSALKKGLTEIGFSAHSFTPFDTSYCIKPEEIERYYEEIAALKKKYADKIKILFGFEQDYYSPPPPVPVDYLIGSVHYIKCGSEYVPADEGNEKLRRGAEIGFGSDLDALAEEYFRTEADVVRKTGCGIIGHFDTITKYCQREPLFNTASPRYRAAWQAAVEALLPTGVPFEINTGTISRGVRVDPLPNYDILEYIAARGGCAILSSDAHAPENIAFQFDRCEAYAKSIGLKLLTAPAERNRAALTQ